jgi:hypothetical protein
LSSTLPEEVLRLAIDFRNAVGIDAGSCQARSNGRGVPLPNADARFVNARIA